MALRMNLFGWHQDAFAKVLGSKDSHILEQATEHLSKALTREPSLSEAKAWLHKLIDHGYTLRENRSPPTASSDGDLVVVRMELETHIFAVHSLVRAIALPDDINLATRSSYWWHSSVAAIVDDFTNCGFSKTKLYSRQFVIWLSKMNKGSPLFGDDFLTPWSFYTCIRMGELTEIIPVLQAALDFKRPLPEGAPEEYLKTIKTELSPTGKQFVQDLITWFKEITEAGQDAFIMWY